MTETALPERLAGAGLTIVNPSGNRTRVLIRDFPFLIGRQAGNHVVLRDNRISRVHARIVLEGDDLILEDLGSRAGVLINGQETKRHTLAHGDRIEFGVRDSYRLVFTVREDEIHRMLGQIHGTPEAAGPGAGNLVKLRALLEVARSVQSSLSTDEVLEAVIDAALAVTGSERGFLFLHDGDDLSVRVARDRNGQTIEPSELSVPGSVLRRALDSRRELLSMSFDPDEMERLHPGSTFAGLELRSVVCVPLVKVKSQTADETLMAPVNEAVGVIYMDSRLAPADLSSGNRELLQTLALEASTILENARLLEEQREKQRLEEELNVARKIQTGLLPNALPDTGWFRAAGSSVSSTEVGGDYFDVRPQGGNAWNIVLADVSGKGVSSALLASLLQGAFLLGSEAGLPVPDMLSRINHFLNSRTQGEKYATLFCCRVERSGQMVWANAGHPAPLLVRRDGHRRELGATGMPVGLLEEAEYAAEQVMLDPGDKLVIYSDGVSEARNDEGRFFGASELRRLVSENASLGCRQLHGLLSKAVEDFTGNAVPSDDVTLVVLEYSPGEA